VPYDAVLADRIRELLLFEPDVAEKRMFGGIAFLIGGHIAVAVSSNGGLLLRVEHDDWERLLAQPHVGPFVNAGRKMRGWVRVDEEGLSEDADLEEWVRAGVTVGGALPPSD
jgi:TfoX/Sxy family transcriptional regulator of competence genes